ncbi:hypothetical protein MGSAQ_000620 [marine sediment metagenome]|uniref:Uncharacterized protein n=1 Tax=marine sediment metagenome TaxID=412755 RepID=A0A1B6NWW2_9ZZZZ
MTRSSTRRPRRSICLVVRWVRRWCSVARTAPQHAWARSTARTTPHGTRRSPA